MSTPEKVCSDPMAKLREQWRQMNRERERERAALLSRGVPFYDLARYYTPVDWSPFYGLICGAKGKRTGKPCLSRDIYANGRCRHHGGLSTGPKTPEGRARSGRNGKGKECAR